MLSTPGTWQKESIEHSRPTSPLKSTEHDSSVLTKKKVVSLWAAICDRCALGCRSPWLLPVRSHGKCKKSRSIEKVITDEEEGGSTPDLWSGSMARPPVSRGATTRPGLCHSGSLSYRNRPRLVPSFSARRPSLCCRLSFFFFFFLLCCPSFSSETGCLSFSGFPNQPFRDAVHHTPSHTL